MFFPALFSESSPKDEDGVRESSHSIDLTLVNPAMGFSYEYQKANRAPQGSFATSLDRSVRNHLLALTHNEGDDGVCFSELGVLATQRSPPAFWYVSPDSHINRYVDSSIDTHA